MRIVLGIVFALIGIVGLLTSPSPEGPVKDINTVVYWLLVGAGIWLTLSGLLKRRNKRH